MLGRAIAAAMELYALVDLLCDALFSGAVRGCEGGIVAEGATYSREQSVTIGAGETGIDGHLLQAVAKTTPEVGGVGVKSSVIAPRILHRRNYLALTLGTKVVILARKNGIAAIFLNNFVPLRK